MKELNELVPSLRHVLGSKGQTNGGVWSLWAVENTPLSISFRPELSMEVGGTAQSPANVTVDLRSRPLSFSRVRLGVRASYAPVVLPLECDAAVPRLWKLKAYTEGLKSGCESVVWWLVTWWCQWALPASWGSRFVASLASRGSFLYASLPGPYNPLQVAGYSVKHMYTALPPSQWPLSVSVVTYANQLHLSCTVRRDVYRSTSLAKCILKYTERQVSTSVFVYTKKQDKFSGRFRPVNSTAFSCLSPPNGPKLGGQDCWARAEWVRASWLTGAGHGLAGHGLAGSG
ncbi:O-acyltransferase WSD1 C-terminal [Trinorchestia longiramus]|nr:O-acyltransferase WSD1 C-terminal [Trinorchestia longiramus]